MLVIYQGQLWELPYATELFFINAKNSYPNSHVFIYANKEVKKVRLGDLE